MPDLTLFTAPKPFRDAHIATIQRNALRSWKQLEPDVEVVVIGGEEGIAEACAELGVQHEPQVARNASGTPLISGLFETARRTGSAPLLAYVNADILLLEDFLEAASAVRAQSQSFLLVGQRWDLDVTEPLGCEPGWQDRLRVNVARRGTRHGRNGSDYFIFPRGCFTQLPDFAVGRAGWDNWMIYEARRQGWPLIDLSEAVDIVHQNHDYRHLPGGQPHYRQPESFENIRFAGGRMVTRFTLDDATHTLNGGRLQRVPLNARKLRREVEIFPLVRLRSQALGSLFHALFHPRRAYREWRQSRG